MSFRAFGIKIRFCLFCGYSYLDSFNSMNHELHIYAVCENMVPPVRKHSVTITATKGLLLFISVSCENNISYIHK